MTAIPFNNTKSTYVTLYFLYLHDHWIQEENIALDNLKLLYINYFND